MNKQRIERETMLLLLLDARQKQNDNITTIRRNAVL